MTGADYSLPGQPGVMQARCLHCQEIVMISSDRDRYVKAVVAHMMTEHMAGSGVMVEALSPGEPGDFLIEQAPWRCDLCGSALERPFWEYVTPPTKDWAAEDEGWLVCDPCQPLVEARELVALIRRSMAINAKEFGVAPEITRRQCLTPLRTFINHFDPRRTRRVTV